MTGSRYFEKFRKIKYNNQDALDIISGATLIDKFINQPFTYYPYEITQDKRADIIAEQYYDDSYMDWLIYYANKIVDPYFNWLLTEEEFESFIIEKYGSVAAAKRKTIFYRVNWYADDTLLSEEEFAELNYYEQKYWTSNYNENTNSVLHYKRKPIDVYINTNKTISLETEIVGTFKSGDLVDIYRSDTEIGTAELISYSNSSIITLKHIDMTGGNFTYNDVIKHHSNTSVYATILSNEDTSYSNGIIQEFSQIPTAEATYWEKVNYYDYEYEKNLENKIIKLIDNRISNELSNDLTDLLKNGKNY